MRGRSKQRHTDKGNHGPGLPTDQRELGFEGIVANTQAGWEHNTSRDKLRIRQTRWWWVARGQFRHKRSRVQHKDAPS